MTNKYRTPSEIKAGDRVQHPDGRIGTVLVDPGWAAYIHMDGEPKPELWQVPFVVINFTKVGR